MSDPILTADRLMSEKETGSMLGVAPGTLRYWRSVGDPHQPPYVKLGRSVRYRLSDIKAYIAALSDQADVA